jgi:hypothetical protein
LCGKGRVVFERSLELASDQLGLRWCGRADRRLDHEGEADLRLVMPIANYAGWDPRRYVAPLPRPFDIIR